MPDNFSKIIHELNNKNFNKALNSNLIDFSPEPVPPPKKQRDPDLDLGLASLIGGSNEF